MKSQEDSSFAESQDDSDSALRSSASPSRERLTLQLPLNGARSSPSTASPVSPDVHEKNTPMLSTPHYTPAPKSLEKAISDLNFATSKLSNSDIKTRNHSQNTSDNDHSAQGRLSPRLLPEQRSPALPVASKADAQAQLPAPKPTRSVLGKLFDPSSDKGELSDHAKASPDGITTPSSLWNRRPSTGAGANKKPQKDIVSAVKDEHRQKDSQSANHKPSMANSLKGLVEKHAVKLKRGGSIGGSRKSDDGDGRSESDRDRERGDDKRSVHSTSSLLQKYGVCERGSIAQGSTAIVRLAHKWDRKTEKLYAVKEFRKRKKAETEKEYVKHLTSEFCISSTLHHENVVETVDLVQDDNQHWCEVMEYCPGGDLYAVIKRGNLTIPEIESYFKQMMNGINYIHSMGVAHRDIKPENLLLDINGRIKITDFGVSDVFRMCWDKTVRYSSGRKGSEPYMAPELFVPKEYDARLVDVWAAAVVLYILYVQQMPWRRALTSDPPYQAYVNAYSKSSKPPPLDNLPKECIHLVKRMLDPSTKTRAGVEEVMKDKWFQQINIVDTKPPGINF